MPAIPAPTMQTSVLIFLSSADIDRPSDVADQGDTPPLEIISRSDLGQHSTSKSAIAKRRNGD
jgi:hypothetical protein